LELRRIKMTEENKKFVVVVKETKETLITQCKEFIEEDKNLLGMICASVFTGLISLIIGITASFKAGFITFLILLAIMFFVFMVACFSEG